MAREIPKPGEFYRHFKNKKYEIVTVASHSETGEKFVIYRALYGTYQDYARPLDMFMSEVDHKKYPDVAQTYRFEKIGDRVRGMQAEPDLGVQTGVPDTEAIIIEETDTETESRELLMDFLNMDGYVDKIELLRRNKNLVDDKLIDDIGVVMDLPIKEGDLEERFCELLTCLRTMSRYDGRRLRDK